MYRCLTYRGKWFGVCVAGVCVSASEVSGLKRLISEMTWYVSVDA